MWKSDREALEAYKTCFDDVLASIKEGKEVDYQDMCVQESNNLLEAAGDASAYYKQTHAMAVPEFRKNEYNPILPYSQNM